MKKKHGPALRFSNLMNIGKKKLSSQESPDKCVDTSGERNWMADGQTATMTRLINFPLSLPSGYLNVLVNSQWRTCWCLIKNGQLWFYQDKGKNKVSQPAVTLEGCSVSADPSPEHLYSFRIEMDGTQLATLEVDHW